MKDETIESVLQQAKSLAIEVTENYNVSPSILCLCFSDSQQAETVYDYLLEDARKGSIRLHLRNIVKTKLDMSLILQEEGRVINIDNIEISHDEFSKLAERNNDESFIFMIAYEFEGRLIVPTEDPTDFSPIIIKGYTVSE